MKKPWRLAWLLPMLLVTGCPNNHYEVELTPHGEVMERKLVFYRADGVNSNGVPDYSRFDAMETQRIARTYPANAALVKEGERHTVKGDFASRLPDDVGGSGSYRHITTSLGSAGFYLERFRGDDDLASGAVKRLQGADRFTDFILGWSRMELGRERGYDHLRQFLNTDLRQDFKNLSMYSWMMQTAIVTRSETPEEFAVRFGQYLAERGYLKLEDLPDLFHACVDDDTQPIMRRLQQLVATKLGVPANAPSLAFLSNADAMQQSWRKYLMTTDVYRAKMRHWQKEQLLHGAKVAQRRVQGLYDPKARTNSVPAAPARPTASEIEDEIFKDTMAEIGIDFGPFWRTFDHLAVRLALPIEPAHSNGRWDAARKQMTWESNIEQEKDGLPQPAFCYANWSEPDEAAQKEHFGRVLLSGDDLSQYCLWRAALPAKDAEEWDALIADLQPGNGSKKLEAFRFSSNSALPVITGRPPTTALSDFPKQLLLGAMKKVAKDKQEK